MEPSTDGTGGGRGSGGPRPVVFVHGFNANANVWGFMKDRFRAAGYRNDQMFTWEYETGIGPIAGHLELKTLGAGLAWAVRDTLSNQPVDLVAHSMGSLITRQAVKYDFKDDYDDIPALGSQVAGCVSLAGPNHGVSNVWVNALCSGITCGNQVADMRKNSTFLNRLNQSPEAPGPTNFLTYRTPGDEQVDEDSVQLSGADNRRIDLRPVSGDGKGTEPPRGGGDPIHNSIKSNATVAEDVISFLDTEVAPPYYRLRLDRVTMTKGDEQGGTGDDLYGTIRAGGETLWQVDKTFYLKDKFFPFDLPQLNSKWIWTEDGKFTITLKIMDEDGASDDELVNDTITWDRSRPAGSHTVEVTGRYGAAMATYTALEAVAPDYGTSVMLTARHSGKTADRNESGKVIQYHANFTSAQRWTLVRGNATGVYQFKNAGGYLTRSGDGKVVAGTGDHDGAYWHLTSTGDGYFFIEHIASRTYLDVPGSSHSDWEQLITYGRVGTENQQWTVSRLGGDTRLIDSDRTLTYSTPQGQYDTNYFHTTLRIDNSSTADAVTDWQLSFRLPQGFCVEGTDSATTFDQTQELDGAVRVRITAPDRARIGPAEHTTLTFHGTGNKGQRPVLEDVILDGVHIAYQCADPVRASTGPQAGRGQGDVEQ